MTSLAPGKIILTGEYAVLRGHPAVAVSVDRYVRASIKRPKIQNSFFLQEVVAAMALEYGSNDTSINLARAVDCDSSPFRHLDQKIGLGSSAAVAVAAVHTVLKQAGKTIDLQTVHRLAHLAHRNAQKRLGASGSGVDIAVSTYGGVMMVESSGDSRPCSFKRTTWPENLFPSFHFLNQSASTPLLVKAFHAAGKNTQPAVASIGDASSQFFAALQSSNAKAAIMAFNQGYKGLKELEESANMSIIPNKVLELAPQANELEGALKTTGAGGGDIAIGLFASKETKTRFEAIAEDAGLVNLPLTLENQGVHPHE